MSIFPWVNRRHRVFEAALLAFGPPPHLPDMPNEGWISAKWTYSREVEKFLEHAGLTNWTSPNPYETSFRGH